MKVYAFHKVLYDEAKQSVTVTNEYIFVPAPTLLRIEDDGVLCKIHTQSGNFYSEFTGPELLKMMDADVVAIEGGK
jgi:hypothetical protein